MQEFHFMSSNVFSQRGRKLTKISAHGSVIQQGSEPVREVKLREAAGREVEPSKTLAA